MHVCMYVSYLFSKQTLVYADCDDNPLNPLGLEGVDFGGIFYGLECQRIQLNINTDFFSLSFFFFFALLICEGEITEAISYKH